MKGIFKQAIPVVMFIALASSHVLVNAAPQCNGLNEINCSGNPSCTWVSGYVTKKGNQVNAYCRVKSSSKQSKSIKMSESGTKQAMHEASK
jgi:hypothetical protein